MAYLFVVENNVAKPNTEVLLIPPFKEIWERDTSNGKEQAIRDFTFMEFMTSKKKTNPYAGYDENARFEKLAETYYEPGWEMDNLIELGLAKIEEFQLEASVTYRYYTSTVKAAEKLRTFFEEFDIMQKNEKGALLYKPADITRAINDTDKVLHNLNSMKEKVEQELFEQTKTRGNKTINPFEV